MSNPSLVIVLLEDDLTSQLIRRYLRKYGLDSHQMRFVCSPFGRGSAENWVRKQYPLELKAYRRRQLGARAKTALIVVIDADTVQDRQRQLDESLSVAGVTAIDPDREDIARLIPKRNIETWILCLNGNSVDETTDYKQSMTRDEWGKLVPEAAQFLHVWQQEQNRIPQHCVSSLRKGIDELKRLNLRTTG